MSNHSIAYQEWDILKREYDEYVQAIIDMPISERVALNVQSRLNLLQMRKDNAYYKLIDDMAGKLGWLSEEKMRYKAMGAL